MAASSTGLHEAADALNPELIDRHRAIVTIMEELEAVDWYDQRVAATDDEELAAILAHNRDEEKEHAAMVLEWLRRRDPKLDEHLHNYLFIDKSPLEQEHELKAGGGQHPATDGSLGIGSLCGEVTS